jgi:hypothetical protein
MNVCSQISKKTLYTLGYVWNCLQPKPQYTMTKSVLGCIPLFRANLPQPMTNHIEKHVAEGLLSAISLNGIQFERDMRVVYHHYCRQR